MNTLERFFTSLETAPMTVASWLAAFAGVLWVRYFIEAFSNKTPSGYLPTDLPTLIHYTISFIAGPILLVVIVSAVTHISPLNFMRVLISFMPILWLGPLIDLTYGGARIAYVFAATPAILLKDFLTYFGPANGITLGLRIEIGLAVLILGAYVYIRTKRISAALIGALIGYSLIFVTLALPSLIGFFFSTSASGSGLFMALQNALIARSFLHPSETYAAYRTAELLFDAAMAQSFYIILSLSGVIWLYQVRKNVFLAIFRNIRPERLAHFLVAGFFGGLIALAEGSIISWTILDVITIFGAVITIVFAGVFAIVTNDLADEVIDAVSNTDRPLITGALTRDSMHDIAIVCGLMTLLGALSLGSYALFLISILSACYYVYSVPPLRLKRVPVLASALIGIATLTVMLLGFFLVSINQQLTAFPAPIALLVLLFVTLVANVRDIKDIKGDSRAGIWTIPTLLGSHLSRMVIGGMTFVACMLVPLFIPITILWLPSIVAGTISWVGLARGLGERFIFSLYFLYLVSILWLLIFGS